MNSIMARFRVFENVDSKETWNSLSGESSKQRIESGVSRKSRLTRCVSHDWENFFAQINHIRQAFQRLAQRYLVLAAWPQWKELSGGPKCQQGEGEDHGCRDQAFATSPGHAVLYKSPEAFGEELPPRDVPAHREHLHQDQQRGQPAEPCHPARIETGTNGNQQEEKRADQADEHLH